MIYVDISNTKADELEMLFNSQEVYASTIRSEGSMHGFIELGSSWGTIFYYVQGNIKDSVLHNSVGNYDIDLS